MSGVDAFDVSLAAQRAGFGGGVSMSRGLLDDLWRGSGSLGDFAQALMAFSAVVAEVLTQEMPDAGATHHNLAVTVTVPPSDVEVPMRVYVDEPGTDSQRVVLLHEREEPAAASGGIRLMEWGGYSPTDEKAKG